MPFAMIGNHILHAAQQAHATDRFAREIVAILGVQRALAAADAQDVGSFALPSSIRLKFGSRLRPQGWREIAYRVKPLDGSARRSHANRSGLNSARSISGRSSLSICAISLPVIGPRLRPIMA